MSGREHPNAYVGRCYLRSGSALWIVVGRWGALLRVASVPPPAWRPPGGFLTVRRAELDAMEDRGERVC